MELSSDDESDLAKPVKVKGFVRKGGKDYCITCKKVADNFKSVRELPKRLLI